MKLFTPSVVVDLCAIFVQRYTCKKTKLINFPSYYEPLITGKLENSHLRSCI